jgi:hypothetical protein
VAEVFSEVEGSVQLHAEGKELELLLVAAAVLRADVVLGAGVLDDSAENAGFRLSSASPKVRARSALTNRVE